MTPVYRFTEDLADGRVKTNSTMVTIRGNLMKGLSLDRSSMTVVFPNFAGWGYYLLSATFQDVAATTLPQSGEDMMTSWERIVYPRAKTIPHTAQDELMV